MAFFLSSCGSLHTTDPPQTATTQFLQTTAARQAVEKLTAPNLQKRTVYVRYDLLHEYVMENGKLAEHGPNAEQKFLVAELRAKLLTAGARLMDSPDKAQIILEIWSGGLGVDRYQTLIGVPSATFSGVTDRFDAPPPKTPEVVLYENRKALGIGEIAFIAYWKDTGQVIAYSRPGLGVGRREDIDYFIMGRTVGNVPTLEGPRQ